MSSFIRKYRKTIELGRAIERAVEGGLEVTKAKIEEILAVLSTLPLDDVPHATLVWWRQIGSHNPKPLMEELIRWMNELGKWSQPPTPEENDGKKATSLPPELRELIVGPDYQTCFKKCRELVYGLNRFFIKVPRLSKPGRPKGKTRPKVTPEVKEGVRTWLNARNKKSRCSVAALARKLEVSRSTIYRVIEEIR